MPVTLTIPDSVVQAIKLPEGRMVSGLAQELAVALYADGLLSLGKARQLAGLTKQGFAQVLADSRVPRHYASDELRDDLRYAGGQ